MKKLVKEKTLSEKAYSALCDMIAQMKPGENRLPSEDDLARLMGISRATVREALKYLMLDGVTTTIHGKGTFAHPSVFALPNRLDQCSDFLKMLEEKYDDVGIRVQWMPHAVPSALYRSCFGDQNETVLAGGWIYTGGGQNMLYGYYEFCPDYLVGEVQGMEHCDGLPQFSRQHMKKPIDYCSMTARMRCDKVANAHFGLELDQAILCWDEKIYDIDDNIVATGMVYVHPTDMELSVVTRLVV